jgi:RNA polymerase sigma-70 factor (ECF subfamily)
MSNGNAIQHAADSQAPPHSPSLLSDDAFLSDLRRQMLRFATLQLSDAHLAEDAVQEALIGALKNAGSFGRRSALKTWVFAILKNKIADTLRRKQRLVDASSLLREDEEEEDFSALFDAKGHWHMDDRPATWGSPELTLREGQFWKVFEACLDNLPGNQVRVFMMREFIELDTSEICATVGVTVTNLNVMLHRARLRLRECLEDRWFLEGEESC